MNCSNSPPLIAPTGVHVWRIPLRREALAAADFAVLTAEEQQRATRFRNPAHGHAWQQCRYALRQIVAAYCQKSAAELEIAVNTYGKPYLSIPGPQFNLSHAESLAVLAVGHDDLGIDLEQINRQTDYLAMAERFFSPAETQLIAGATTTDVARIFFEIWTRKEAYIKGRGFGLSIPLDAFRVSLEPASRVTVTSAWDDGQAWYCHAIALAHDHVTSMACRNRQIDVQIFDWHDYSKVFAGSDTDRNNHASQSAFKG